MFDPTQFYRLASGEWRGPVAMAARLGLRLAEVPYAAAVRLRNRRYDQGKLPAERVEGVVISVGNLTTGGTGKTPMVKWVCRHLRARGLRVAIISRGYGAEEGAKNDEALELEQALPDVPHLQSPDRVAIARVAIEELESQVLVVDDGFQHRRLARDLDIVLLDATQPFGFGHMLPRGTLREPIASLARGGVVCLTRANMISESQRQAIRKRVVEVAPHVAWCEVVHRPQHLLSGTGAHQEPLERLQGMRVAGFCGIGNPAAFRATLENAGATVAAWRAFSDHHIYTAEDVAGLVSMAKESGAERLVCTHKDLVKLRTDELEHIPLWGVVVEMAFLVGESEMAERVDGVIATLSEVPATPAS